MNLDFQLSPRQRDYLHLMNQDRPLILAQGSVRSGKTWVNILSFLIWSQTQYPQGTFIIAGQTFTAVRRNVIEPMMEMMRQMGIKYVWRRADQELHIGGGTYVVVGAHNDLAQDKIQGLTAHGGLLDEVVLQPESFYMQAMARLSFDNSKMFCSYNPEGPFHWFKVNVIDALPDQYQLYRFWLDDNPILGEQTKARYQQMFSGVFYDRYIEGEWTAATGLVFPDWLIGDPPADARPARTYYALDYSTSNVTAMLKIQSYSNGVDYVTDEWYYNGQTHPQLTDEQLADKHKAFTSEHKGVTTYVDPSASSFKATLRTRAVPHRDADNDVLNGIRTTNTELATGRIRVGTKLSSLHKELNGYRWDEDKQNEGIDEPIKLHDHGCDALRYYAQTRYGARFARTPTKKPAGL